MVEIELEKTYLLKHLPKGLAVMPYKEIIDIYIPASSDHPVLRLRRRGDIYEMTKKQPVEAGDPSEQAEHTISLSLDEFMALSSVPGKRARKIRYGYGIQGAKGEIDIFQDELHGLALADFEFKDAKAKEAFVMPDFCLADVTQDKTFAGGMICGKTYEDIEPRLKELGYAKITAA